MLLHEQTFGALEIDHGNWAAGLLHEIQRLAQFESVLELEELALLVAAANQENVPVRLVGEFTPQGEEIVIVGIDVNIESGERAVRLSGIWHPENKEAQRPITIPPNPSLEHEAE